jgi:hypothetical protein
MQYYGQDTKAAENVTPLSTGSAAVPLNFSIDPSRGHPILSGNVPVITNSFLYHQIGNLGVVGFSGECVCARARVAGGGCLEGRGRGFV